MEKAAAVGEVKRVLRKYLPWVVTVLIFVYLFNIVEPADVIIAFRRVDLSKFLPFLTFYVLFFFLWDSVISKYLFTWFATPVKYREMLAIRGATYLVVLLNYMVGQGGLALIMNRWKKITIARASSVVIFYLYLDFFTLLAFCIAGAFRLDNVDLISFFSPGEEGHLVRFLVFSWIFFWGFYFFNRWYLPRTDRLEGMRKNEVLYAFREASLTRYLQTGLLKSVIFIVGLVCNYYALGAFGLHVPFLELSVMMPLVWLIGSIPVTVMRFGTIQAAMIWLVCRYAQGGGDPNEIKAAVFAYSLLWETGLNAGRFIIGAVCITRLPRNMWMPVEADKVK